MSRLAGRARFVYRTRPPGARKCVNYFRCLLCGATKAASAIGAHVARCEKTQEGSNAQKNGTARLPYRDD